ncbi:MAG: polysaccharide pyruvyl transferase family protein [Treponema sp.]
MKFANIQFKARGINNIGDNMQLIAIDNIYKEMGIDLKDIVYIDFHKLAEYDGEYVVLPISMPMIDYVENGIAGRFSPHIIPVFLGLNMVRQFLYSEEADFLRMHQPIGCRDEWCLDTMRKNNIKAYLHGCITFTLPETEKKETQNKIYIVDADKTLVDMLPKNLFAGKEIVYKTHFYKSLEVDPKTVALEQYNEYKENAALVITGLLHCALPCYASGIPVVMVNTKVSYRKAFLESLIEIWTPEKLTTIHAQDGEIKPSVITDVERQFKKQFLETTKTRILEVYKKNKDICDISLFYEQRRKSDYVNDAVLEIISYLNNHWIKKNKSYTYSIWGLSQISEYIFDFIRKNYPNAKLINVYDSFKTVAFMGKISCHPKKLENGNEEFVFVTTIGAVAAAKELEAKLHKTNIKFAYAKLIK